MDTALWLFSTTGHSRTPHPPTITITVTLILPRFFDCLLNFERSTQKLTNTLKVSKDVLYPQSPWILMTRVFLRPFSIFPRYLSDRWDTLCPHWTALPALQKSCPGGRVSSTLQPIEAYMLEDFLWPCLQREYFDEWLNTKVVCLPRRRLFHILSWELCLRCPALCPLRFLSFSFEILSSQETAALCYPSLCWPQ